MTDLFSPAFKADPFPTYARLRREAPVYPHHAPDGRTIWYITRQADVAAVLKDNEHFTKDYAGRIRGEGRRERPLQAAITRNMLFADPPEHTRLRALVNQAFTPRRIQALAPRIETVTHQLLDTMAAAGPTADFIAQFALPLPVAIIAELLGIPAVDRRQVAAWTQGYISPGSHGMSFRQRKRATRAFVAYLETLFDARRRRPQDDLITALVQAEQGGDRLSAAELSSMVALLLVTGHETTVNQLGNGVLALLRHPEQWARLRQDSTHTPAAVEELLRYDGPVETSTTRWVAQPLALRGQQLRRGDVVRAVITSANRDPAVHARPDTLDLWRTDTRHLQFGLGIHYCLGAPLARLEAEIALRALGERLPDLRLAVPDSELAWRSGVLFRGVAQLPVTW